MHKIKDCRRDDRLAWFAERRAHLDRPYLITGPQAAYAYHRWLTPLDQFVTLLVYPEDVPVWRQIGRFDSDGAWQVFESLPTSAEVQAVQALDSVRGMVMLQPTLEPARYRRRHDIDGLTFSAPEDLCLDLLERARGETSVAEAAAILIVQRDALAWDMLLDQAERRGLARRLGVLLEVINTEAEAEVIASEIIKDLSRRVDTICHPMEVAPYTVGRQRAMPSLYQSIGERWGIRILLPRHVVGKVAFDLHPQRK